MKKKSTKKNKNVSQVDKLAGIIAKLVTAGPPRAARSQSMNISKKPQLSDPKAYIRALLDPFNPTSAGVKIPDFDGTPSYTLCSKDIFSISTNAVGSACGFFGFVTPVRRNLVGTATTTTGTLTTGSTWASWSDYSGLLATTQASATRVVAGGFRITSNMSAAGLQAAQGRIIIGPISNGLFFDTATVTEAQLRKQKGSVVIPLSALTMSSKPVQGATRPLDPSAYCYLGPDYTLTGVGNDDPQLLGFVYLVVGAPVTLDSFLEVEMVCHWEVIPRLDNATLVTPGVASSHSTIDEAMNVSQTEDPIDWSGIGDTIGGLAAAGSSAYNAYRRQSTTDMYFRPGFAIM
jgi:hypothetical protein